MESNGSSSGLRAWWRRLRGHYTQEELDRMIGGVGDGSDKPGMLALPELPEELRDELAHDEREAAAAARRRATRPPLGWQPEPARPAAASANGSAPGVVPPPPMPPRGGVQAAEAVLSLARCPHCGGHVGLVPFGPNGRA